MRKRIILGLTSRREIEWSCVSCCRRLTYVTTANRLPLRAHATSNAISHALQLLEMNAKLSPTSANALASVGDIWLAKKDTTKAVGYDEKALAMRPGLQRAKDVVQKLKRGT